MGNHFSDGHIYRNFSLSFPVTSRSNATVLTTTRSLLLQYEFTRCCAAWWCNGYDVGLATQRLRFNSQLFRPLPGNILGQVVHKHTCLCHQAVYTVIGQRASNCPTTGKVTVGLASHWPCITGFSDLSIHGLNGLQQGPWASCSHTCLCHQAV